jgi:hypothetical protein
LKYYPERVILKMEKRRPHYDLKALKEYFVISFMEREDE